MEPLVLIGISALFWGVDLLFNGGYLGSRWSYGAPISRVK